jgi:hypothetical protein
MEHREKLINNITEPPTSIYKPTFEVFLFLLIAAISNTNMDIGTAVTPTKNVNTPSEERNSIKKDLILYHINKLTY